MPLEQKSLQILNKVQRLNITAYEIFWQASCSWRKGCDRHTYLMQVHQVHPSQWCLTAKTLCQSFNKLAFHFVFKYWSINAGSQILNFFIVSSTMMLSLFYSFYIFMFVCQQAWQGNWLAQFLQFLKILVWLPTQWKKSRLKCQLGILKFLKILVWLPTWLKQSRLNANLVWAMWCS